MSDLPEIKSSNPLRSTPKFAAPRTRFEINCEIIALAVIAFSFIYLVAVWSSLPEKVPSHFGFSGKVDAWAGKGSLILFVGLELFLYVTLTVISRFPQIHNYPWKITAENRDRQYLLTRQFLAVLKLELVSVFAYLEWQVVQVARGSTSDLGVLFLPVFIAIILVAVVVYIFKAYRAR